MRMPMEKAKIKVNKVSKPPMLNAIQPNATKAFFIGFPCG